MTESPLRGKVALVTGGGTGFGLAAAVGLAQAGAHVVVCGRRAGKLATAVARISARAAGDVYATSADVSDPSSVRALIDTIDARHHRLDVLVNNAGVLHPGLLGDVEPAELQAMVATNLLGPLLVTHAALELMKRHGYGRIVNVTSGLGWKVLPGYAAYAATKAGVNAFTRNLAAELTGWNILVNAIDPGVAQTELNPRGGDDPEKVMPGILRLATLATGGPNGLIFRKDGVTQAL